MAVNTEDTTGWTDMTYMNEWRTITFIQRPPQKPRITNHSQDYSQNKNYTGPELQWFCSNSEYTVPYFMSYTYMYEQNSTILQLEGTIEGQEALYCCMYIS